MRVGERMSDVTDPTARLFDQWARDGQAERMQAGHLARASQALEALPIAPGQRLLDLGCGNGWATRMLHARAGATGWCYGVDAAPDMIARAREQSALLDRIEFQVATFDALPWPGDHFAHAVDQLGQGCVLLDRAVHLQMDALVCNCAVMLVK